MKISLVVMMCAVIAAASGNLVERARRQAGTAEEEFVMKDVNAKATGAGKNLVAGSTAVEEQGGAQGPGRVATGAGAVQAGVLHTSASIGAVRGRKWGGKVPAPSSAQ